MKNNGTIGIRTGPHWHRGLDQEEWARGDFKSYAYWWQNNDDRKNGRKDDSRHKHSTDKHRGTMKTRIELCKTPLPVVDSPMSSHTRESLRRTPLFFNQPRRNFRRPTIYRTRGRTRTWVKCVTLAVSFVAVLWMRCDQEREGGLVYAEIYPKKRTRICNKT